MKNICILYHANCPDGFGAAWVAHKYFNAERRVTYLPMNYGQPIPPEVDDAHVYFLDFSFKRAQMKEVIDRACCVVVLDHHKTAEEELRGLQQESLLEDDGKPVNIKFDMNHSGMRLAWDYFFLSLPRPWLVDYVEDRDLWRHALPNSEYVSAALRSYPMVFDMWNGLSSFGVEEIVLEGQAIRRAEEQIIAAHLRQRTWRNIAGHAVPVANATTLFSEIAGALAVGHPFGACYFDRGDGMRQWSLRSAPDGVDVSEIAKHFGGGGHKHAAGFQTISPDMSELAKILTPGNG